MVQEFKNIIFDEVAIDQSIFHECEILKLYVHTDNVLGISIYNNIIF